MYFPILPAATIVETKMMTDRTMKMFSKSRLLNIPEMNNPTMIPMRFQIANAAINPPKKS